MKMRETKREKVERLVLEALNALGVHALYVNLYPAVGHWRSSPYADVYRFEGSAYIDRDMSHTVDSWNTMTDCARYGITMESDGPCMWLVNANLPKSKKTNPDFSK